MSPIKTSLSVTQLHSDDYGGGAEVVARLNHRALMAMGHVSQLIVARKQGADSDIDELRYKRGLYGSRRLARFVERSTGLQYIYSPSFRHIIDQFRFPPDVIHMHAVHGAGGWADLAGFEKFAARFPTVLSLQDLWWLTGHCAYGMECERWKIGCGRCPDLSRYPAVLRDATRWNWKRKRRLMARVRPHVIAPTEWVKRQALESPIFAGCKVCVVSNPVDTEVFTPGDRITARQDLGVPMNKPSVLVAANHLSSQFKGAADAVEVLNALEDLGAFAVLVGRDSSELAKHLRISNLPLGYIASDKRMADCYRAADIFLIPSRVETFGLVAAEAAACGAAVVGYQAGGLGEVISSVSGLVIPDRQVGLLLQATRELISMPDKRLSRVRQGQLNAHRLYSPNVHAEGCQQVYRMAIHEFHKPPLQQ